MKTFIRPPEDWVAIAIVTLGAMFIVSIAHASIEPDKIVLAVIGEAEGCPAIDQEAIARATINRGTLKGVYGYKRALGVEIAPKSRQRAEKALKQARLRDITDGADHWLSTWDLKHCREPLIAWRHKMKVTLKTDNFTFYKGAIG